jgi:Tol biopolymer transport system component
MDSDGKNEIRLTNNSSADIDPAWSPNGKKIVFISDRDGDMEVFIMNADGMNLTQLTINDALDHVPAWSNDGSKIVYASDNGGVFDIYVMNADGSSQVNITNTTDINEFTPAWSPTNDIIAFVSAPGHDLFSPEGEIYIMNADGSDRRRLTDNEYVDFDPNWDPSGLRIAFAGYKDGIGDIFIMNADGSQLRNLSISPNAQGPAWSPLGNQIVFDFETDSQADIYVMSQDGTDLHKIADHPDTDARPDWQPIHYSDFWVFLPYITK